MCTCKVLHLQKVFEQFCNIHLLFQMNRYEPIYFKTRCITISLVFSGLYRSDYVCGFTSKHNQRVLIIGSNMIAPKGLQCNKSNNCKMVAQTPSAGKPMYDIHPVQLNCEMIVKPVINLGLVHATTQNVVDIPWSMLSWEYSDHRTLFYPIIAKNRVQKFNKLCNTMIQLLQDNHKQTQT
jgi:hypothetical protein